MSQVSPDPAGAAAAGARPLDTSPPREGSGARGLRWLRAAGHGRVALLVFLGALLFYLPLAGSYGLWDPWETHYGEVARQMTVRGDFISLWWPGSPRDQETFWSKPVLTFWLMSLSMHLFRVGLRGAPDGELALTWRAEWALRLPGVLMAALALVSVYWLVARRLGRRAGLLAAAVLASFPMFSLIARQAMTDMIFLGPMTAALCLGALALWDERHEPLPRRRWGRLSWPHARPFYATIAAFALTVLPQLAVYSAQLRVVLPWGGRDRLMYGAVAMIPYYAVALGFLFLCARLRHAQPLYLCLAAMLCGLAVLAKGLAGLGLPVIVFLSYVAATWRWRRLARAGILPGLLVAVVAFALVAVPWHHSMWIRHGPAFWEELFGDNHWRRMVLGRHGDRGAFDYFLRELGFGIWPWLALAPAALWSRLRAEPCDAPSADAAASDLAGFGAIWFLTAYAVVSASMTKFHHYLAPALPGLAIVIGCHLDVVWRRARADVGANGRWPRHALLALVTGLPLLLLVLADLTRTGRAAERFLWLFNYDYVHSPTGRPWPEQLDFRAPLAGFAGALAVAALLLCWRRAARAASLALVAVAAAFTLFLLDVYLPAVTPYWTQKDPIAEYYRHRRSPDEKLVAYMMYWRGETFYTANAIYEGPREERTVFDTDSADRDLQAWLDRNRGRRTFFLFERGRQGRLVALLPAEARGTFQVLHQVNNKFSLARADL